MAGGTGAAGWADAGPAGAVSSGPPPPRPPEPPVIFGFINADLPLPSFPVNTEGVRAKELKAPGGRARADQVEGALGGGAHAA